MKTTIIALLIAALSTVASAETHQECYDRVTANLENPTPDRVWNAVFSGCGESESMCTMRVIDQDALYQVEGRPFTEAQYAAQYESCAKLPGEDDEIK